MSINDIKDFKNNSLQTSMQNILICDFVVNEVPYS